MEVETSIRAPGIGETGGRRGEWTTREAHIEVVAAEIGIEILDTQRDPFGDARFDAAADRVAEIVVAIAAERKGGGVFETKLELTLA